MSTPGRISVHDDFFWSVQTTAVRFGTERVDAYAFPQDPDYAIGADGVYTILDTGATAIYLSKLYFSSFMEKLEKKALTKLEPYKGRTYARCVPFPSLFFLVDGQWLEVVERDYVLDVSRAEDGSICLIQILPTNAPFHVFGMPLFVDYTVEFDDDNMQVAFNLSSSSEKAEIDQGDAP